MLKGFNYLTLNFRLSEINPKIKQHGPHKYVKLDKASQFTSTPSWSIDDIELKLDKNITYLGSVLGDNSKLGAAHSETRIRAVMKSYYGLQGAGIKYPGVNPVVSLDIYNIAVRSVLVYGCSCEKN